VREAEAEVADVTPTRTERYTLVYDGHCGICTRFVTRLRKIDRAAVFEMVPSQADSVYERFSWIPEKAYAESLQLVRNSDNRTWQGAAAVEEILREIRAGWILSWMFALPFARPIAERLYRWVADHRGELGCGEHCPIQTTPSAAGAKNS
jgi:predicted DCC family thiol-disulfide oxidoreductase YuxK